MQVNVFSFIFPSFSKGFPRCIALYSILCDSTVACAHITVEYACSVSFQNLVCCSLPPDLCPLFLFFKGVTRADLATLLEWLPRFPPVGLRRDRNIECLVEKTGLSSDEILKAIKNLYVE